RVDGSKGVTFGPYDKDLVNVLVRHKVEIVQAKPDTSPSLLAIVATFLPYVLFIGIFVYFIRQMQQGGSRGAMTFGRSRAKLQGENEVKVTFADVAGCDEAKEEVAELVEFLRDPGKFQKLGGRIPRGILMVGSPGTGKTLLARAIAGEAKVPFFSISGSDFVEMFVGVGDLRRRDQIPEVDMGKGPLHVDVDAMTIARGTPGFSGADLANLVNEAALFAARENAKDVRMEHFDKARDKILMGTERRSMAMSETEKTLTAYHEAGHAIVGRSVPEHDPVYKVTIIPLGRAL